MEIKNYNQYEDYYTKNACSIVSLLNVLKYRYAIFVVPNFIIKLAIFFSGLGLFNIAKGGTFKIVDRAIIYYLNKKLGLNFELVLNQISKLKKGDNETYQVGIKSYGTYKWNKIKADGKIIKTDIDYLTTWTGGIGHAANWDGSAKGYFIDTDGSNNTKMSLQTLKYALEKDIVWDNIRTVSPADFETMAVTDLTIQMFKAEKKGKLDEYLTNTHNIYLEKAKKLYFYGR